MQGSFSSVCFSAIAGPDSYQGKREPRCTGSHTGMALDELVDSHQQNCCDTVWMLLEEEEEIKQFVLHGFSWSSFTRWSTLSGLGQPAQTSGTGQEEERCFPRDLCRAQPGVAA